MKIEHLVNKAQQGDGEAMEVLCRQFSGLMKSAVYRQHLRLIADDASSVAYLAFIEAVKSYTPGKQVPFAGYAKSKVQFAVWNFFKRECRRWQVESSLEDKMENDLGFSVCLRDAAEVAKSVEMKDLLFHAMTLIRRLPSKQQSVIFSLIFLGHSPTQTAKHLGITPQAVHGLKLRAIKSLRMQKDLEDL